MYAMLIPIAKGPYFIKAAAMMVQIQTDESARHHALVSLDLHPRRDEHLLRGRLHSARPLGAGVGIVLEPKGAVRKGFNQQALLTQSMSRSIKGLQRRPSRERK